MFSSKRIKICIAVVLMPVVLVGPGCFWFRGGKERAYRDVDYELYKDAATAIEYPDVESGGFDELAITGRPRTVINREPTEYWGLSLEECIHLALKNSRVLRNLGGAIVDPTGAEGVVRTVYDPALQESDPRFGVEAALSAFDAEWSTQAFFEKNDRAFNNQFFGGGTRLFKQDLLAYTSELSKRTATGTDLAVRHNVQYDFNNAPGNAMPNLPWGTNFEVEVRQPILQGAGVQFNRIAGPGATPGVYNGVVIARINTDIQLSLFQEAVTDLVFSVEYLYWELYAAYRRLDAKIAARDRALETWRIVNSLKDQVGADEEAQAREQYYRLENDVQNALNGQLQEKANITSFRGTGGVHVNERRLRLLMGLPINDGRLIRPKNEPLMAKIVFDWNEALVEALMRRSVLQRRKWLIKQSELELVAAKNFLLPRLDTIGRYRWRGLGHDLITDNQQSRFESAFGNLNTGDFQEWQLGFELSFPVGYRRAHAEVRRAELELARSHAMLHEQEREVTHDLSNAIGEVERAYTSAKLNYNRRLAARQQLAALEAKSRGDLRTQTRFLHLILDAQRRLADAETLYYNSLAEYMLAIRLVHRAKGSLLDYNEIHLAEGPWPAEAYRDAARRRRLRLRSWHLENFVMENPPPVSRGPIAQDVDSTDAQPLPAEIVPAPDVQSSPLPPAPPPVRPDRDDRLYDSANFESTRRRPHGGQIAPEAIFAAGKQGISTHARSDSDVRRLEKRRTDARQSGQPWPGRVGNRLPLEEIFKLEASGVQPSVLPGTLLEQPLAIRMDSELGRSAVVRLATGQPDVEAEPSTRFAGGQTKPNDQQRIRQADFDDFQKRLRTPPRPSPTPGPPRIPKRRRSVIPPAKSERTLRPRRNGIVAEAPEPANLPVTARPDARLQDAIRRAPIAPAQVPFQYPQSNAETHAPTPVIEHVPAP